MSVGSFESEGTNLFEFLAYNTNVEWSITAEDGDSAWTLSQQAGISFERAKEIMESQGMPIYLDSSDGVEKSAVDPGDIVTIPEKRQQFVDNLSSWIAKKKNISRIEGEITNLDN